ncbi:hypothetical protein BDV93DRAFT_508146 [Ceratobasidium sp. AG-I]|nr:hypothetical protein BDV93DRAFT_508146 [Ceratobasidium sp. AG-I]
MANEARVVIHVELCGKVRLFQRRVWQVRILSAAGQTSDLQSEIAFDSPSEGRTLERAGRESQNPRGWPELCGDVEARQNVLDLWTCKASEDTKYKVIARLSTRGIAINITVIITITSKNMVVITLLIIPDRNRVCGPPFQDRTKRKRKKRKARGAGYNQKMGANQKHKLKQDIDAGKGV